MKLVRYNNDAYQILNGTGAVAFMALRLANGKWGAYDGSDVRLTRQAFYTPKDVRGWLENRDALEKERGDE